MRITHKEKGYVDFFKNNICIFQGFYNVENEKTIFIVPGDCFESFYYLDFAKLLFLEKYNVFILNYIKVAHCFFDYDKIVNKTYLNSFCFIRNKIFQDYNMCRQDLIYFAHSRGAIITFLFFENIKTNNKVILYQPLIYLKKIKEKRDIKLCIDVLRNIASKNMFKLSFKTFCKRFLSSTINIDIKRNIYKNSIEIVKSVIFDKLNIDYFQISKLQIVTFVSREDKAVDLKRTLKKIKVLETNFGVNFGVHLINGCHSEIIYNSNNVLLNIKNFI